MTKFRRSLLFPYTKVIRVSMKKLAQKNSDFFHFAKAEKQDKNRSCQKLAPVDHALHLDEHCSLWWNYFQVLEFLEIFATPELRTKKLFNLKI